jgi:hypothetical protein
LADAADTNLELFKLYLETAEKVSDRRADANTWMLSVNSAIVALYGYLSQDGASVGDFEKSVWLWAIPATGILVCLAWAALLSSYSKLNEAKFAVLQEIEASLPLALFTREQAVYEAMGRRPFSGIEKKIPFALVVLYGMLLVASLANAVR